MADVIDENQEANEWMKFGMRIAVSTAFHPIEYAKVLIQLGYEPLAPRHGRTFLGQKTLILPNIFEYVKYIKKMDGWMGLYQGLSPKLLGTVVASIGSDKIVQSLGFEASIEAKQSNPESLLTNDKDEYRAFEKQLKRDFVLHVSGIVIFQPFSVISTRMMAQFIGNESTYKSIWLSIKEIWTTEGILGFFSGIMPKLLFDTTVLFLASTTSYAVSKYYIRDQHNQPYFASFAQFVFSTLLYPLNVVSVCMAVTGSRLAAGIPPFMPIYKNWNSCYNDLKDKGELKRGSSLFFRYQKPSLQASFKSVPFPAISRAAM